MARRKSRRTKKSQPQYVIWLGTALLVILAIAFGSYYLSPPAADITNDIVENGDIAFPMDVSVDEAFEMRDSGAFILDVRTQEEWEDHHIPGATLIVLDELDQHLDQIPTDQDIVVVCRSGNRSQVGRDILLSAGFANSTSMTGGMNDWISSGYEYVTGP